MIYLDSNATTQPAPEVVEAMMEALRDLWANPSSLHRAGQAVRRKMDLARQSVAELVGCKDRDLVFTSGGTEAANLAVCGSLRAQPNRRVLVTTRIEHSANREMGKRMADEGIEVLWLESNTDGVVEAAQVADILSKRADEVALVCVMWCNNETGVIQPVKEIGAMCAARGVRFYTDATQWVGKMPVNVAEMPFDLMSFAAHKFHGPKGVGALYVKPRTKLVSQTIGGPQERQRRGGTENTSCILGMGVAAQLASQWLGTDGPARMEQMRNRFEQAILSRVEGAVVNGANAPRGWNTSNIAFTRLEAEAILLLLSEKGVCASGGSACASGSLDPSPVLKAMGLPCERSNGSVRFSFCRHTTDQEIDQALDIIPGVINRLRQSMAAVANMA